MYQICPLFSTHFFAVIRYNPEDDSESKLLRHRAVALQDMAHSFLDHELSEDFEKVCLCVLVICVWLISASLVLCFCQNS